MKEVHSCVNSSNRQIKNDLPQVDTSYICWMHGHSDQGQSLIQLSALFALFWCRLICGAIYTLYIYLNFGIYSDTFPNFQFPYANQCQRKPGVNLVDEICVNVCKDGFVWSGQGIV